jgi:hypothetical protein
LALRLKVTDGGRYLNDWYSRIDALLALEAEARGEGERLREALRQIAKGKLSASDCVVLAQVTLALAEGSTSPEDATIHQSIYTQRPGEFEAP